MTIQKLDIKHVRIHDNLSVEFSSGINLIIGPNGSGKTTLIEAIYYSLRGTSFKTDSGSILKNGELWWRIDLEVNGKIRTIKYDTTGSKKDKTFIINNKESKRLLKKDKLPVVLFEPEDMRLINGSPSRRRQFLDGFISQLNPEYDQILRKYDRALKQRNTLLKNQTATDEDLFVWNVTMSEYGVKIINERQKLIKLLNESINEKYHHISKVKDKIELTYSHYSHRSEQQRFIDELSANLGRDKIFGYTSFGPHRHDVLFSFNDQPADKTASRGETRSLVLALKFLELDIINSQSSQEPIVLLDDVFSELDDARSRQLLLEGGYQTFITSTFEIASENINIKKLHL